MDTANTKYLVLVNEGKNDIDTMNQKLSTLENEFPNVLVEEMEGKLFFHINDWLTNRHLRVISGLGLNIQSIF